MGLLIGAGAAGFLTLLIVLGLGRRVESTAGRWLLLLVALALATVVSLLVLRAAGLPVVGAPSPDRERPPPGELPPFEPVPVPPAGRP